MSAPASRPVDHAYCTTAFGIDGLLNRGVTEVICYGTAVVLEAASR